MPAWFIWSLLGSGLAARHHRAVRLARAPLVTMPAWFIWSLLGSGLAAAIFYKKSKDPGFDVLKGSEGERPRTSSKP